VEGCFRTVNAVSELNDADGGDPEVSLAAPPVPAEPEPAPQPPVDTATSRRPISRRSCVGSPWGTQPSGSAPLNRARSRWLTCGPRSLGKQDLRRATRVGLIPRCLCAPILVRVRISPCRATG
jgi:hypothetical protein